MNATPSNYREEVLKPFFKYIKSGESFYVVGAPSVGKTRLMDFLMGYDPDALREGITARFYLDHIDRYFTHFNSCRKAAERGVATLSTGCVAFHLEGVLASINRLHSSVNRIVGILLFEARVRSQLDAKKINARQYAIIHQVLSTAGPPSLDEFRSAPWYVALYTKRTVKTRQRDLRRLVEADLLHIDDKKRLWPGFLKPSNSLSASSLPLD